MELRPIADLEQWYARELTEAFEASGLVDALPDTAVAEPDGPSPAQQYQELYDLLF